MKKWELVNKSNKKVSKTYLIRLNKKKDADIIEALDYCPNKNGYIKVLLKKDLEKNKKS